MTLKSLDNLLKIQQLKLEPKNQSEFEGLVSSGKVRLSDAKKSMLSLESRFDLAYNAAHALSLAALRWHGYRSSNRFVVFQVLPHTLGLGPEVWRVLAKCHESRNLAEYEGFLEIEEQLLQELLFATDKLLMAIESL